MLMIAAGYEDGNDADALRRDPMFKLALDRLPAGEELCSKSTISRLENLPDRRSLLRLRARLTVLRLERRRNALSSISTTPSTACMAASNYAGMVTETGSGAAGIPIESRHGPAQSPSPSLPARDHPDAIWLYLRFTLSYRDVEELVAEPCDRQTGRSRC
jgi:hypothetical protein